MSQAKPNLFRRVYDWTLSLAEKKSAGGWLATISFAEASFFPHSARRTPDSSLPRRPKKSAKVCPHLFHRFRARRCYRLRHWSLWLGDGSRHLLQIRTRFHRGEIQTPYLLV